MGVVTVPFSAILFRPLASMVLSNSGKHESLLIRAVNVSGLPSLISKVAGAQYYIGTQLSIRIFINLYRVPNSWINS